MGVITGGKVVEGLLDGYTSAGAPVNGTDEVQHIEITGTPTGGTYQLAFEGFHTADIAFDAAAAAVQAALEALPTIGSGGVGVTGNGSNATPFVVTFGGDVGKKAQPLITLFDNSLTGGTSPTLAITEATPGVDATARGAATGAELIDITNGVEYINTGTGNDPVWTVVGTQS